MKYALKITINTDGDFCLPFVPREMKFDGNERYDFEKTYENRTNAIKDAIEICSFLKAHTYTSKEYIKQDWYELLDRFMNSIRNSEECDDEVIYEYMGGNYEGTEFTFYAKPHYFQFGFYLTDEECEMVKKQKHNLDITDDMIKEAVLNLYNGNNKKDKNIID